MSNPNDPNYANGQVPQYQQPAAQPQYQGDPYAQQGYQQPQYQGDPYAQQGAYQQPQYQSNPYAQQMPPATPDYSSYATPQHPERWNGMAIAGFVCSFFIAIIGLILSIIGLTQVNKTKEKGKGLAIAGIIIAAVEMIGSIALMATGYSSYMDYVDSAIAFIPMFF